jgi:hypothetical protein
MKRALSLCAAILASTSATAELIVCIGPERQIMRSTPCEAGEQEASRYGTTNTHFVKPSGVQAASPRSPSTLSTINSALQGATTPFGARAALSAGIAVDKIQRQENERAKGGSPRPSILPAIAESVAGAKTPSGTIGALKAGVAIDRIQQREYEEARRAK